MAEETYFEAQRRQHKRAKKMNTITIAEFGDALAAILEEFVDECEADVGKAIHDAGIETRRFLRTETPPGAGKYRDWAEYQSGWSMESEVSSIGEARVVIRNKKKPGLTHLLEKGHVMSDGRRAKAFPHIAPALEVAERALDKYLRGS